MGIVFKLETFLEDFNISKNALAREAKVRPNLVYEICGNKTKRIEVETFNKLLAALEDMTGRNVSLAEIVEYRSEKDRKTAP